jgi:hypothetical protein
MKRPHAKQPPDPDFLDHLGAVLGLSREEACVVLGEWALYLARRSRTGGTANRWRRNRPARAA